MNDMQTAGQSSRAVSGLEPFEEIAGEWNSAAGNWDAVALASIYTDDAVFFGSRPGISVGQSQVKDYFASYLGVVRAASMRLEDQHVRSLSADALLAQGHASFVITEGSGTEHRLLLRTTLVAVRRHGRWKLLQHHFSPVPS